MADNSEKYSNGPSSKATPMKLQAAKTVQLRHLDAPPKITRPKRIHPRRLLPFVREGQERPTHSLNARAVIRRADDPMQEIRVLVNTELTQPRLNDTAGAVGEPSVSANSDVVFYTGNWYAAVSTDRGQNFKFIDPNSMAQPTDPEGVTFCCDQVVNYIPSIDTFVWLLQYRTPPNATGDNIQRLAFAKTDDVKAGRWKIFDITTAALEVPGFFLDFPDLATSDNFLYMTTNCFGPDQQTVGSAVVRIPFKSIDSGAPTAEKFLDMTLFSFRVAQNCHDTAYFASHRDTSTLAVFSWPENQASPTSQDVPNARWIGTNGYISRTPDGRRWLDRADPRITGATLAGDELWFAWSVDAGSNHRPKPFVQMARINSKTMTLIEDVNLFDTDSAICYAGLSTNANGEVGVSYMIGGAVFPSHVVGILSKDETNRRSLVVAKGERSPLPDKQGHFEWGDFLTVRPVFPDRKLFVGTGYTLKGTQDSDNQDATPRFVIFGRVGDSGAGSSTGGDTGDTRTTTGGSGSGAGDSGGTGAGDRGVSDGGDGGDGGGSVAVGDGPITDVNTLPTVSSAVAAKIKTACGVHKGVQADMLQQALPMPQMVTSPGSERWKVKTGQDNDVNLVGKNIINGVSLGAGIVPATVEELISIPRPPGFENARGFAPPQFDTKRAQPVEIIIWRVEVSITVLKLEKDGDFHLVLQGASGKTMVGEIPTPTKEFIGDSPWLKNIHAARQTVQDKLLHNLSPQNFVLPPGETKLMPRNVLSGDLPVPPMAAFKMPQSFTLQAQAEGEEALPIPTFMTAIPSTPARVTGIGFFDRMHDQTGVAPNVLELHTILKVEWL